MEFTLTQTSKPDINILWQNLSSNSNCNSNSNSNTYSLKELNDMFIDKSVVKINLINYLLKSDGKILFGNQNDLIKLFELLENYNQLYGMASNSWNHQIKESKLFIQNSISKQDTTSSFYNNYINLIKKKLIESNINFNYFEFRLKRFNKTKDIIFVFDLEQFTNSNKK